MRKNLDIEALRAFAIVITITAHLGRLFPNLDPKLAYFWLGGGVDLFFCVSGFVIASSLIEARRADTTGTFAAVAAPFWIKRAFRLWPAALFWAVFCLACTAFFNRSGVFGDLGSTFISFLAAICHVANLHISWCASRTPALCHEDSLWVYWSLSLEEQFYLLFPLLFLLARRKPLLRVLIFAICVQFFLKRDWPSLWWFARTDAICMGILIALAMHSPRFSSLPLAALRVNAVRIGVTVALPCLLVLVARPGIVPFYHGMVALVSAALVFLASFDRDYFAASRMSRTCLGWIGGRSYSMYLTHAPAMLIAREISFRVYSGETLTTPQNIGMAMMALALMLLLTEISVRIIETPLRKAGRNIAARQRAQTAQQPA